jgi:hypothetical protein
MQGCGVGMATERVVSVWIFARIEQQSTCRKSAAKLSRTREIGRNAFVRLADSNRS